jgi:hypothetical protein
MTTRTVTVYYETDAGEMELLVEVSPDGLGHCVIETDLSDVPADELAHVTLRAEEKFWEAERADYLRSPEAERDGA